MRIDNSFFVAVPPERAWQTLLDVPKIAPCLPGARLTEVLDGDRYKGEAAVKLGPVQLQFGGEAQLSAVNLAARTARVTAKGADRKGRGNATAVINFRLSADGAGTRINVGTDLTLTGSIAQYGRASGLIKEIANELVNQFAANLSKLIGDTSTSVTDVSGLQVGNIQIPSPESSDLTGSQSAPISGLRLLFVAIARMFRRPSGRES
jgi:carbon monoxide dehydrogenase subunit G